MNAAQIAEVLSSVYDPELAIDIVALGLVYGIDPGGNGNETQVTITTTSPACPMSDALYGMAEAVLRHAFPGESINLELSFSPAWSVEMADDSALSELGLAPR